MTMQQMPGVSAGSSFESRQVLRYAGKDRETAIPIVLDRNGIDGSQPNNTRLIRAGWLLGRNKTTGRWSPCKRTQTTNAATNVTAVTVREPDAFAVDDEIRIGGSASVTITAINYGTKQLTISAARSFLEGDVVRATNGTETARAILLSDQVNLNSEQGLRVDRAATALIAGYVDADQLRGDVDAIMLDAESRRALSGITFDDFQSGNRSTPNSGIPFGLTEVASVYGNQTLTADDSGKLFVLNAAATITLPARAAGLMFGFYQSTNNAMTIASNGSADDIIALNDASADSVTYSTAGSMIGSMLLVFALPGASKWVAVNLGGTTATIA